MRLFQLMLLGAPGILAAQATSPAGNWIGIARIPGSAALRIDLALDSTAGRWGGTLLIPAQSAQSMTLASVTRLADSVLITLPAAGQNATLRLMFSADGRQLSGSVIGPQTGQVGFARAGSPDAVTLQSQVTRADESRMRANRLAVTPAAKPASSSPDSSLFVTSDIPLFWGAVDRAPADSLADYLEREYLQKASVGVRSFIQGRILSAEDLAVVVRRDRARYDAARAGNVDIAKAEPEIRAAFRQLKAIYPPAVFPDVYFVIGRFNSGGTSSKHGLLIGAEMYPDPSKLPAIVSHELIHFQQGYPSPMLLEHSFMEGSADFIGEMIAGKQINNDAHKYGMAHEAELWAEFRKSFDSRTFFPWMYGRPTDGKPNDLGYFIGYRIAQAYYNKAADKTKAIREIIEGDRAGPGAIRRMLAESGYDPK